MTILTAKTARKSTLQLTRQSCRIRFVTNSHQPPLYRAEFHQRMSEGGWRHKKGLAGDCLSVSQQRVLLHQVFIFPSWSRLQFSPRLQLVRRIWRKHFEKQLHCCNTHRLPGPWVTQSTESEARVQEEHPPWYHSLSSSFAGWAARVDRRDGTPPKGSSLHENISCAPSLAGMTHVRWTLLEFLAGATPRQDKESQPPYSTFLF